MTAYYNEFEPYAAQWLRNLISAGHIAPGDVDERSIVDVGADDLKGYTQCHFFAGIGGWSLAARLAGWSDDRELWTGSCPCQPFSVAGKGEGQADERHLWPEQFRLISARRPAVWMGEQVAAAVGKHWLDGVHSDLESIGYAGGAAVVPACAVDAPHRRDRAWIVANRDLSEQGPIGRDAGEVRRFQETQREPEFGAALSLRGGEAGGDHVAYPASERGNRVEDPSGAQGRTGSETSRSLGNTIGARLEGQRGHGNDWNEPGREHSQSTGPTAQASSGDVGHANEFGEGAGWEQRGRELSRSRSNSRGSAWVGAEWLSGADGKARRFEPSIRLLAHGVPARVGKLRAYGNAIVPQVAAEVIAAFMEARP